MPEQEPLRFDIQRRPVEGLSFTDAARARWWVRQQITVRHLHAGGVQPRFVYLGEGWYEEVALDRLIEFGREEVLARAFVAIGQREGILRRFRVGEALVRDEAGRMRRAIGALEHQPTLAGEAAETAAREGRVAGSWWLVWRFVGQEGDGSGALRGEAWQEAEGDDVDDVPEGFREWLEVGRAELESLTQREPAEPAPLELEVRMAIAELRHPLPDDPKGVAAVVGDLVRDELRSQGLRAVLVFAATDSTLERWEVRGDLPCTLDDFMRSLATRDEQIEAIGHIGLASFEVNGQTRKGYFCDIERGGRRGRWLLPLMQAGDALPPDFRGMESDLGPVTDPDSPWLGVEPAVRIDFSMLGFEDQAVLPGGIAEG